VSLTKKTEVVPDVLDTKAAAQYLGVSHQWLEVARVRGTGPAFVRVGRCVRYRKETIDRWLADQEVSNTAQNREARR
jgi:predicted DNA-binding transcriptional regulator AlpA